MEKGHKTLDRMVSRVSIGKIEPCFLFWRFLGHVSQKLEEACRAEEVNMADTARVHTASSDALSAYLSAVRDLPVLSREEELKVIRRAQRGDREAWEQFIRCNLRYVVSVSNRYKGCGVPLSDLIHEGNIGLIEAARRFDPKRGVRFITYAVWWIRQAIVHALASQGGAVHLSVKQAQKRLKVREKIRQLEQSTGGQTSIRAVAEALDEMPEEVALLRAAREPFSLDSPLGAEEGLSHLERLTDGQENPAEDRLNRTAVSQQMELALSRLPRREAEILKMRFGFSGDPMTLQEIGDKMSLSRERIRQLEKQAIRRLKGQGRLVNLRNALN